MGRHGATSAGSPAQDGRNRATLARRRSPWSHPPGPERPGAGPGLFGADRALRDPGPIQEPVMTVTSPRPGEAGPLRADRAIRPRAGRPTRPPPMRGKARAFPTQGDWPPLFRSGARCCRPAATGWGLCGSLLGRTGISSEDQETMHFGGPAGVSHLRRRCRSPAGACARAWRAPRPPRPCARAWRRATFWGPSCPLCPFERRSG